MVCAQKLYRARYRYLEYVKCRAADFGSGDWRSCVPRGMSADKLRECAEGEQGRKLLAQSFERAEAMEIRGSPTWLVNGRHKFNGIDEKVIRENFCTHNPKFWGCRK